MGLNGPKGATNGTRHKNLGYRVAQLENKKGELRENTCTLIPYIALRPPNNRPLGKRIKQVKATNKFQGR